MANRLIGEVAVGGSVNLDDEELEKDVHPKVVHAYETTAVLMLMCTEAIQWIAKCRNM